MAYQNLELVHFRSHSRARFEFKPDVNVITGPNGSGKTNLLEALFFISTGSPFRGRDLSFVEYNENKSLIKTEFGGEKRELKLIAQPGKTVRKEFKINDHKIYRLAAQHKIPVCLFEPGSLQVIYGGPDLRRNLLDQFLIQTNLAYQKALAGYKRALLQRNNLLKADRDVADDELFIWNVHLSEHGNTLVKTRTQWVEYYNTHASEVYGQLSGGKEKIGLVYQHASDQPEYGTWLLSKLQASNKRDQLIGFTMNGPHRDDLKFFLNGQPAELTASRGEIRSLILTYKILETMFIEEFLNQKPLIMLDDVFSELDESRQAKLLKFFQDHQTFITTTHYSDNKFPTIKL